MNFQDRLNARMKFFESKEALGHRDPEMLYRFVASAIASLVIAFSLR
jgi:hypothetical protein